MSMNNVKKAELLAPAGDPEKLKIAVLYGADAVYFGGETFSLRTGAGNLPWTKSKKVLHLRTNTDANAI